MAVMEPVTFRFAGAARRLTLEARRLGLRPPAFRSPPRLNGVARSLRRRADGGAVVAVVLRGRPWSAVLADLIDGVVAANALAGLEADRARAALWEALGSGDQPIAA
jgi:hypothetical protein